MPGTLVAMADRSTAHWQHLRFALALHQGVAPTGDSCISPYSVASALGMVCHAARGTTADEVRALLADGDPDIAKQIDLLRDAATLNPGMGDEVPVFAVSNTLWAWDQLTVNESFRTDLAAWPGAKVELAPFVTDPEKARQAINADVAETTRDLIQELVPEGAVGTDTVASLVNALYLKVGWRNRFADQATMDEEFHAPSGSYPVPTMRQSEELRYACRAGWQVVVLPAAGGVEAVVLLPDDDLAAAESSLDADLLAELLSAPRKRSVELHLPKLHLTMNKRLVAALEGLGVHQLFTEKADLGGLSDDPRLMVSDVLHESVLKLDEEGLEGAAATAVMIRLTSMPTGEPTEVRVDRPFLLLVRHAATGVVYFLARVVEPAAVTA